MKEIKLFGHKVNSWYLIGGGAGVILVFFLYKRGASSGATSGTASTGTVDPATGVPYSLDSQVDPLTGMTYLSEAQQYGSVQSAESAVSSGTGYSPYSGYSGTAGYPTGYYGSTTVTGSGYASNAAWSQAVTAGLSGLGYSATDVAAALGLYFQDHPLGTAPDGVSYLSIVQAAVAEYGPPPVRTFSITGSPTNGGGGGSQVQVPNVTGQPQEAAVAILSEAGLKASATPTVAGKTLTVDSQSPSAGSEAAKGSTVTLHSTVHGSSGKIAVPSVVGMEQSKAYADISAAGLHPVGPAPVKGKVHTVTAESPKAGTEVDRGTAVHLTSKIS